MKTWRWGVLLSVLFLAFLLPHQLSASCTATSSACACGVTCSGQSTCSSGSDYVECDGNRRYCTPPCSIACPNAPYVNCDGCFCYYWQHYISNTDAIACTIDHSPVGPQYGIENTLSCPGGDYSW
jgi:hypothetical protein